MAHTHEFYSKLSGILNSSRSRVVMLHGNVYDLFYDGESFVPLVDFLSKKGGVKPQAPKKGITQIIYQMDRDIVVVGDEVELSMNWDNLMILNKQKDNTFANLVKLAKKEHTLAVEFLRQLCLSSHLMPLKNDLLIIIEGIEALIPMGSYAQLGIADRTKIGIFSDWFRDPKFNDGNNSVILIGESRSLVYESIAKLPQLLSIEVPAPTTADREQFILSTAAKHNVPNFVEMTAGLSILSLRQLLCSNPKLQDVVDKIEEHICGELGEDVVEFKRPTKTLKDVIGFTDLKKFITEELIPRFQASGDDALSGAAVGGPIGGGKTFLMEATIAEIGMPVMVLKNLRSQFFGQTDVIFERLRRVLISLGKVCVFVDEADTMFGGVSGDVHETEKRLTGKVQAMMSAPELRGKVIWLLMTARIDRLSPDIRRPGRAGDLIIPVLDPEGADAEEFRKWCCSVLEVTIDHNLYEFTTLTAGYSAASYQALRARLKADKQKITSNDDMLKIVRDMIPADIGQTRRYQVLQALMNCTRRSLLPADVQKKLAEGEKLDTIRGAWKTELLQLERSGV